MHHHRPLRLFSPLLLMLLVTAATTPARGNTAPGANQPVSSEPSPVQLLQRLLQDVVAFGGSEAIRPAPGTHQLALNASWTNQGVAAAADFEFVRGPGERFLLKGTLPGIGPVTLGQGAYPWLLQNNNTLLCGTLEPQPDASFTSWIAPAERIKYQTAMGLVSAATMMPGAIANYCRINELPPHRGERRLQLNLTFGQLRGPLGIAFNRANNPAAAYWRINDTSGSARIDKWQLNCTLPPTTFNPPATKNRRNVAEALVLQRMAAVAEAMLRMIDIE